MNSEIFLPLNTLQSVFFGFPNTKENFQIINHLHLILKYYLFKVRDWRKISLEGLRKSIIKIYNIEKQIWFNDSKKEAKFFKHWHILLENLWRWTKFTAKGAWTEVAKYINLISFVLNILYIVVFNFKCKYYLNITFLLRSSINRLLNFTDVNMLLVFCQDSCIDFVFNKM